uniref:Endonuclease/exonuclease/phosphatase domain-containing protein n=1 Tax=Latimeria chalumnae TaxID=7897 RepID=H3BIT3_LATCH
LSDVWRLVCSTGRDFSFYSHPHDIYSHIDMILVLHSLVENIAEAEIGYQFLSDHAPVSIVWVLSDEPLAFKRWRLNCSLLYDKKFCFPQLTKQLELEREVLALEKLLMSQKSDSIMDSLRYKKKFELNTILTQKVEYAMFRTRQRYFESGEKAGKLLVLRLRKLQTSRAIPAIYDKQGSLIYSSKAINEAFTSFFKSLYSSESKATDPDFQKFFCKIKLPKLREEDRLRLEDPITPDEIKAAIKSMASSKAP